MEYKLFAKQSPFTVSNILCYYIEMIKQVIGYEKRYEISDDGEIYSLNYHRTSLKKILKSRHDKDGYLHLGLYSGGVRKDYRVNRLVAQAFLPNLKNLSQVNHKNGDKTDNRVTNLEWCTPKYNINHSLPWRNQKGEKNNNARLNNEQVIKIWHLKGFKKQVDIAKDFSVSEDTISMIHRQTTWKWLTDSLTKKGGHHYGV